MRSAFRSPGVPSIRETGTASLIGGASNRPMSAGSTDNSFLNTRASSDFSNLQYQLGRDTRYGAQLRQLHEAGIALFAGRQHGKNGNGSYAVRRMTARKRMRKKLQEIKQQLRMRMHDPVPQTGAWLGSVVQGGYFTTTLCWGISIVSGCSGNACFATGGKRSSAVVKYAGTPGSVVSNWPHNGFPHLA